MIDNFAPQPYPLECSADGETWRLVIGWREVGTELVPMTVSQGSAAPPAFTHGPRRYRLADTRPVGIQPRSSASAMPARPERRPEAS